MMPDLKMPAARLETSNNKDYIQIKNKTTIMTLILPLN